MDFALNDEQRMILDTVRRFVERDLLPLEPEVRRAEIEGRTFPDRPTLKALQGKAKTLGLWGISEKPEIGGAGLDTMTSALIAIETARSFIPFQYGGHVPGALYACKGEQRERYLLPAAAGERVLAFALSEPGGGSAATSLQTNAVHTGKKWIINGAKTWITRGNIADFAIVFATTDKAKGHRGGITAFLVDRDMGWTSRAIPVMANSDLGDDPPAELWFADVEVPEENVLGEVGWGFRLAMESIGRARIQTPARAIGMSMRLLEMAVEHVNSRQIRGRPLADYQAIQWMLADCAIEIQTAKFLTLHAAWRTDKGEDVRFEQSMIKLYGAQCANRIADRVLQIHGAMGYSKELPIERVMRQLRVFRIYEGSDEVQKQNVANAVITGKTSLFDWD